MSVMITEDQIAFQGYHTWYRVIGDLANRPIGMLPLLALHGGPGIPHESLQPLELLAAFGRPVILYDQLGCGNSDQPGDLAIYTVALFVAELGVVRQALKLDQIHLLGHSWGGVLAMAYALTKPAGLASLILNSTVADW